MVKQFFEIYNFHKVIIVHTTDMCYNRRCSPLLGLVVIISTIGFANRSAHVRLT